MNANNLCLFFAATAMMSGLLGCSGQSVDEPPMRVAAGPNSAASGSQPAISGIGLTGDEVEERQGRPTSEEPLTKSDGESEIHREIPAASPAAVADNEPRGPNGDQETDQDVLAAPAAKGGHGELAKAPAPKPTRRGAGPDGVEEISFEDINLRLQQGVKFRPFMLTERARELEGQKVRITGVIFPTDSINRIDKSFVLLRNEECKFGPEGLADHLVQVRLRKGVTTSYTTKYISVDGVLKLKPYGIGDITYSVFDLENAHNVKISRTQPKK